MVQNWKIVALYHTNREEFWRVVRYLVVGGWNTVFGLVVYGLFFWLCTDVLTWNLMIGGKDYLYLGLTIPASVISITNAFICFKIFVFKTRGNILGEYFRCCIVYGFTVLLGMLGLYILVGWFHFQPIVANALLTIVLVIVSYLGHRFFSFANNPAQRRDG